MTSKPKKKPTTNEIVQTCPDGLKDHPFFGLKLDACQEELRDAIWSRDVDAIICDACSGSGKTTISLATAILLCQYGRYDKIIYQIAGGIYESRQGMLPGSLQQKNQPLFGPLYQVISSLGFDPERIIATEDNMNAMKEDNYLILAQSDSYIRGMSFGSKDRPVIVILDEVQNYKLDNLRTAITRVNDGSKLIAIGQQKQCDLKYPQDSGFSRLKELFSTVDWCKQCKLVNNYRGKISKLGDEL